MQTQTEKSTIEMVREFHEAFGVINRNQPTIPDGKTCQLRVQLIQDELYELFMALEMGDAIETLDALLDLQYVLDGTFLACGMAHLKEIGFAEVHRSNMSKLDEFGKPIFAPGGKVLKSSLFTPPNLRQFIDIEAQEAK